MTIQKPLKVFDGHNDAVLSLHVQGRGGGRSFFERSDKGHIDLPRAREGGFGGGLFAVFVPDDPNAGFIPTLTTKDGAYDVAPSPALDSGYARTTATALLAHLFRLERESKGQVKITRTVVEIEGALRDDVLAMVLHLEGAEPIDGGLDALEVFYQAGVRALGLVWSRPNIFAEGVPFRFPAGPNGGDGLTERGRALVKACDDLGILIDLSHLNEAGFWDVAAIARSPLVATHSNVHALCPTPRNLTDKQLDAVRDSGGMVGLNFFVGFLRPDGADDAATDLDVMVHHVDYLIEKLGVDHVGLGSDFDGARVPAAITAVAGLPRLFDALRGQGYDEATLQKLARDNWLRALRVAWHEENAP